MNLLRVCGSYSLARLDVNFDIWLYSFEECDIAYRVQRGKSQDGGRGTVTVGVELTVWSTLRKSLW